MPGAIVFINPYESALPETPGRTCGSSRLATPR